MNNYFVSLSLALPETYTSLEFYKEVTKYTSSLNLTLFEILIWYWKHGFILKYDSLSDNYNLTRLSLSSSWYSTIYDKYLFEILCLNTISFSN